MNLTGSQGLCGESVAVERQKYENKKTWGNGKPVTPILNNQ